jgi:kinesin family protein 22
MTRRFTSCYDQHSTQEEIFERDVKPMIDVVYSGVVRFLALHVDLGYLFNLQTVTIFAYGVTSSGKTHTMQGTKSEPGVIPRVVRVRFPFVVASLTHSSSQIVNVPQENSTSTRRHQTRRELYGDLQRRSI